MRIRYRIWSMALRLAAIIATCAVASSTLDAQLGLPAAAGRARAVAREYPKRNLGVDYTRTNVGPVTVACSSSLCENLGVFVTPSVLNVICPQPAGATCTFYVHLETQASVTANDTGVFQFLVDGVAPSPGPTDVRSFFAWDTADPNSTVTQARSYAVVAHVTNSKDNQSHGVEAEFGCLDLTGDGCSATMGLANMSIALYTP